MKRKEVRAEGLGAALDSTNSNTMNDLSKEGIAMTFKQFGRRIGAALALSVALAMVTGFVVEVVAQNPLLPCTFILTPTAGAADPGGQMPLTITVNNVPPQCAPPNTWMATLSPQTPNGITMTSGVGTFPGTVQALIRVRNNVPPSTYSLIILITAQTPAGAPVGYRQLFFPLVVRGGGGTPGPGQARVRVVATPNPARLGETITFQLINEGPSTLQLPNPLPWRIVHQTSGQTFTPGGVIQVVINVAPGGTRSWTWDQRTPMGNQAPPGNYTFIVTTLNGDPREPSVQFSIQGAGGQGPGPGSLMVQLAVDRGCGATYRIGDPISITFSTSQDALVTLTLIRPDGSQQVLVANQSVRGGVANTIQGMVGEPGGTRTLILEATAGQTRGRAECAFTAGGASTTPPPAQFQAFLSTDRGCQETGQNPVYYVGDPIVVQFRIDGAAQAFVTLEDVLPDGQINVLLQQWVPGNVALQLMGWIAPPLGRETLRLTVQVGQQVVVAECSFTVAQ